MNDTRRDGARSARVAISVVFLVNGVTFASWMPRLPEIQDRLGISDAALGITLVGAGVGGLAASGFSGRLVDRFGSRTMTLVTSAGLSMALPLMGIAPTALLVFCSLIVLGSLDGLTDVAMNAQAVELQRRVGRSIITRFHALWSAGAVTGGIIASRAAAAGISLRTQLLITAAVLVATTLIAARWLLPDRRAFEDAHEAAPSPRVGSRAIIGRLFLVGLAIALAEAPPNEWAALLMTDRFDLGPGAAGLGFVAVASGMLVGRVVGDHVTDRYGLERTRRGGAGLAAVGVLIATLRAVVDHRRRRTVHHRPRSVDTVPAALPRRQRVDPRVALGHGGVLVRRTAGFPRRLAPHRCAGQRHVGRHRGARRLGWRGDDRRPRQAAREPPWRSSSQTRCDTHCIG